MCNSLPTAMKDQKSFEVIVQECASEKRDVVDKLFLRSEARIAEMERKKTIKDPRVSLYEQTDFFNVTFNIHKQKIESKLLNSRKVEKKKLLTYFDEIVHDFQELQKFLSDSTLFLPTYDIKKRQEALKVLQDAIHSTQSDLIPKKKFTFKRKKQPQTNSLINNDQPDGIFYSVTESFSSVKLCECGFKDLTDKILVKKRVDVEKQDVGLHHLQRCTVYLYGAPSAIFISGLEDCHIFAGPVSTSVFVENCSRCTFVLACQQLRIHACLDSYFYLHITSRTIIEDSKDLYFAPYNWTYENQDEDFKLSGLDRMNNNWDSIDDFNWLVMGTPSPNWFFLEKSNYKTWT